MLLAVIMNLSDNPSVTPLLKEFKLLPAMFYYVSPVPQKDSTWLPSQFEEIQLQCLASIPKVLPQLFEELVEIGGLDTLTQYKHRDSKKWSCRQFEIGQSWMSRRFA